MKYVLTDNVELTKEKSCNLYVSEGICSKSHWWILPKYSGKMEEKNYN